MHRPIILIPCSNVSSDKLESITGDTELVYADKATAVAVLSAGGQPLYLPAITEINAYALADYLELADGLLIPGADTNTDPALYGEVLASQHGRIDGERDKVDLELVQQAYKRKIPILGICKGMQTINVALGGTLFQVVNGQNKSKIDHDIIRDNRSSLSHDATVVEDSMLLDIYKGKARIHTNAGHQQAVKVLSRHLKVVATADDGVIEAFEAVDYPFLLAVQFHPELRPLDSECKAIFETFIDACKRV